MNVNEDGENATVPLVLVGTTVIAPLKSPREIPKEYDKVLTTVVV